MKIFPEKKTLLILFITAFIIRLAYIGLTYDPNFLDEGDNRQYLTFAQEILNQGIFVEDLAVKNDVAGWWGILGPGYPLIIALFILIFGSNFIPIFIFNAFLTSLAVIVLYYLAKELTNKKLALVVALWGVFYINYLKCTPFLLKESVVYLLLPASILFIILEVKKNQKISKYMFFAILVFVYLIHTDERYFAYSPFLLIPFLFEWKTNKKLYSQKMAIWFFGVILLMVPWLVRNYLVYDQFVILTERTTILTSKFGGENLTKRWMPPENNLSIEDYHTVIDSIKNGFEVNLVSDREIKRIQWGLKNGLQPRKFSTSERYIWGIIDFWRPFFFKPTYINDGLRPQQWSLAHNIVSILFYGIFLPFYLMELLYLIHKRNNLLLLFLALLPFVHTFIHIVVGNVLERYRTPVDFIVVVVALSIVNIIFEEFRQKTKINLNKRMILC